MSTRQQTAPTTISFPAAFLPFKSSARTCVGVVKSSLKKRGVLGRGAGNRQQMHSSAGLWAKNHPGLEGVLEALKDHLAFFLDRNDPWELFGKSLWMVQHSA